jgi:hypothetical protein
MSSERRRHPRYVVNLAARLASVGGTATGKVRDLCRDAAFFETAESIPVGTPVEMTLEFPGLPSPLVIKGRVVREAHSTDGRYAVAILFLEETPEFVTQLDFLVDEEDKQ